MSITRALLRAGVCAVLALCLAIPMPVLFAPPVHAKPRVSAPQPVVNFHVRHVHAFVPASSPNADPPASIAPVPIPGGVVVPPFGAAHHLFFPGPTSIRDDGFDVEPSTITNYQGLTRVDLLPATATDSHGDRV